MVKSLILLNILLLLAFSSSILKQKNLTLTIYNNNMVVVSDVRNISFDRGFSMLSFNDVSSNIKEESATFKSLNLSTGIQIYENIFERNLNNSNELLQRYINKNIIIYLGPNSNNTKVAGKLLGYN